MPALGQKQTFGSKKIDVRFTPKSGHQLRNILLALVGLIKVDNRTNQDVAICPRRTAGGMAKSREVTEMDIAQLIYRPMAPQGALKDFEFGRSTMEMRWQQGLSDAGTTLHASPWLALPPE